MLIRAHGEPPHTYELANSVGIEVIDATCPVVARLQRLVREAYSKMQSVGGRVVLLGKRGHAEVIGLTGQVGDDVVVVERLEDLDGLNYMQPIYLLSQTTQSIELFESIAEYIRERMTDGVEFVVCGEADAQITIGLAEEKEFEVFVGGKSIGTMATGLGGKLSLSVELGAGGEVPVKIVMV